MLAHFPDALIDDHHSLIPSMGNHEGDRHVLAAAVRADASTIVTWNLDHFPTEACDPYGIEVQTPDEFLVGLWRSHPQEMAAVLQEQARHLVNPRRTVRQILETLQRSVPRFAGEALASGL